MTNNGRLLKATVLKWCTNLCLSESLRHKKTMRTTFRFRRNLRKIVLCGIITLWCLAFVFYSNITSNKKYASLEIVRRRNVISPRNNSGTRPASNYVASDSRRGQFSVIDSYLNKTERGFFLEIGNDVNETDSLTFLLEMSRDWTGLQIVPDIDAFQNVRNLKRGATTLQSCIKLPTVEWPYRGSDENPCLSPEEVFKLANTKMVDVLVLDLEGWEIDFLQAFLLHDISVAMVTLEVHGTNTNDITIVKEMKRLNFDCLNIMVNRLYDKTDLIFRNMNVKMER